MPARSTPTPRPRAPSRWLLLATIGAAACVPGVRGVAGTSAAPGTPWTPPPPRARAPAAPAPVVPTDIAARVQALTLDDVLNLALSNNTATRAAWADARAAAYAYGAARGAYLPTVALGVTAQKLQTPAIQGRTAARQTTWEPSVSISWLLLDFGGRAGSVGAARDALLAADWTHNATIQNVVLDVEVAFFDYLDARALRAAELQTVAEADTNLAAARERHRVGLATVADVLQAQTARSQAQLALESTEGALAAARGALAVAMGLPANVPYDVDSVPLPPPPPGISENVDSLIAQAVAARPDLAAAQAEADAARARVSIARGAALPSLVLSGNGGDVYLANRTPQVPGPTYTLSLGLQIPLFAGGAHVYGLKSAAAAADAAASQAEAVRQQVIFEVFTSYYALQTATQRVRTAGDLLASAAQSEQVALGRYKAGAGSLLDLLTAEAALADARAQSVGAHYGWYAALAQLGHDVGVLGVTGAVPFRFPSDTTGP